MTCWRCGLEGSEEGDGQHLCLNVNSGMLTTSAQGLMVHNPVRGICPKHGPQAVVLQIHMDIPEKGDWCQTCWCEEIARTCHRLLPPAEPQ